MITNLFLFKVCDYYPMRRRLLPDPRLVNWNVILGWLFQLSPESSHLRLFQSGLPGSFQRYPSLCNAMLFLLLEKSRQIPLATGRVTGLSGRKAVIIKSQLRALYYIFVL